MAILLIGIQKVGETAYELQFMDGDSPIRFTYIYDAGLRRFRPNQEFDEHFFGRTSARGALRALAMFIDGKDVTFPIALREGSSASLW